MRLLADRGVFVPVCRAEGVFQPALGEFFSPVFDPAGLKDELVVLRAQVGMIGVDQQVQVILVFALEVRQAHLP